MMNALESLTATSVPVGYGPAPDIDSRVFTFLLVKLAQRCNINCTYCYWFRDADVYKKPSLLTVDAEDAFCERLEEHIHRYGLDDFRIVFHGGEPLLFPKRRFTVLLEKLNSIEERTGCCISRGVCTNGILLDPEWVDIFQDYNVYVTVSVDGPAWIHDRNRVDFKGRGTHADVLRGIEHLRAGGIEPGLITVCNPATRPAEILSFVVDTLGIRRFDILPPDATHADNPPPIADYYIELFDAWYDGYAAQGVRISTLDSMIRGLVGNLSTADTIGIGAIETVTLMSDGSLEPLDVLRIVGDGSTRTDLNVDQDAIQRVEEDPRWREAFDASLNPCGVCRECEFLDACGGGHLATRWSAERRYDNPSVYCESWKRIFTHIWDRISPTLVVQVAPSPAF